MNYFALIGDIIASKKIQNRYEAQEKVEACLKAINETYQPLLASNFSITLGDEFQGLMTTEAPIFKIVDTINACLADYQIRFGIGLGQMETAINPEKSIGADGPAYWRAREAISYIHQKNDYGNTQLAVRSGNPDKDGVINALLASSEAIKSNWRGSQSMLLDKLLKMGIYEENFDQQKLGTLLNLNSSALSKRLKSSNLKVYLRSREAALQLLRQEDKEMKE